MQAVTALLYVAPLLVLQSGSSVSAFTTGQLQDLALIFLRLNAYAFDVDLVFFGLWCALAGYLIFKSTFMPRVLGVLLAIDGLGWMTFVVPPFASYLFPVIAGASAAAEIPLQLWLLVAGVNSQRWIEQASAPEGGPSHCRFGRIRIRPLEDGRVVESVSNPGNSYTAPS
jgi:hypothetical protein